MAELQEVAASLARTSKPEHLETAVSNTDKVAVTIEEDRTDNVELPVQDVPLETEAVTTPPSTPPINRKVLKPRKSCLRAAESSASSEESDTPRSVKFTKLIIREFPVTLGDHPSTTEGPPLTLDWQPQATHELHVDEYESALQPRRSGPELRMPSVVRTKMLAADHTPQELAAAVAQVRVTKSQRQVSQAMQELEHLEIVWQSALRKLKRWRERKDPPSPSAQWIEEYKQTNPNGTKPLRRATVAAGVLDRTASTIVCTGLDDTDDDNSKTGEEKAKIVVKPKMVRSQSAPGRSAPAKRLSHVEIMHQKVESNKKEFKIRKRVG